MMFLCLVLRTGKGKTADIVGRLWDKGRWAVTVYALCVYLDKARVG